VCELRTTTSRYLARTRDVDSSQVQPETRQTKLIETAKQSQK